MATVRKTITLSASQDAWIKSQIARGAFTNDSEYIRDLVKRDQSQQDRLATLREAIAEGLDSGTSDGPCSPTRSSAAAPGKSPRACAASASRRMLFFTNMRRTSCLLCGCCITAWILSGNCETIIKVNGVRLSKASHNEDKCALSP